jgi:hypothetical protein
MNRIKRVAIVAGLALATATAASAAYGVLQFDGHMDYAVATTLDTPCGLGGLKGPAQPITFDKTLWLVFTCQDDSVIARRMYVTVAAVPSSVPVLAPTYTGVPKPPSTPACAAYPGFVESIYGGCVPPDHPHARH